MLREGGGYVARNKYPEVTVEKILDVAQRLFLEKGYDNTTMVYPKAPSIIISNQKKKLWTQ